MLLARTSKRDSRSNLWDAENVVEDSNADLVNGDDQPVAVQRYLDACSPYDQPQLGVRYDHFPLRLGSVCFSKLVGIRIYEADEGTVATDKFVLNRQSQECTVAFWQIRIHIHHEDFRGWVLPYRRQE